MILEVFQELYNLHYISNVLEDIKNGVASRQNCTTMESHKAIYQGFRLCNKLYL